MNCCNNKKTDKPDKTNKKGHSHPMWMMVLCCGAPILVLAVISLLGVGSAGTKAFLIGILPFICPVMMLVMIPMMFLGNRKGGQHNAHKSEGNQIEEKSSSDN